MYGLGITRDELSGGEGSIGITSVCNFSFTLLLEDFGITSNFLLIPAGGFLKATLLDNAVLLYI
jgi:hypothetical protein